MDAPGGTDAAVLLAMFGHPERPGLVFTERRRTYAATRARSRFPGGRQDTPDEGLLDHRPPRGAGGDRPRPADVEVIGRAPARGTFVTGYKVHPFVGTIPEGLRFGPNPDEVAAMLMFPFDELREGFAMRRLVRRGIPIRTPTYEVGEHLIWGATARILSDLLERLDAADGAR